MSLSTRRRTPVVAVVLAFVALVASGCTAASDQGQQSGPTPSADQSAASESKQPGVETNVVMVPNDGAADVNPVTPVTLQASDGILSEVVLTNAEGEAVAGSLAPDLLSWTSAEPLGYAKSYSVAAKTTSVDGIVKPFTGSLDTLSPTNVTAASTLPSKSGGTYGVGMPLIAKFDEPITDKAAAEKFMIVTTTPAVEGHWYWFSDKEAHWRPQNYYQPGTQVSLDIKIFGQDLGGGLYGQSDVHTDFTVGDAVVSKIDNSDLQLRVYKNGELIRTMPASMGQAKYPTQSGVHVVQEKYELKIMDSSTWGLPTDAPDGYYEEVPYATRISMSGEFVHAAPWSVADQGVRNVSHGCINVSLENGIWYYNTAQYGDVVEVTGTPVDLKAGDGWGDWNIPWESWVEGGKK